MSSLTSPTGPTNTTTIPVVIPQPDSPTPIPTSVPVAPVGASSAPPLSASQTLYDQTVQGDVDPAALLPPDFDIEAWAPALYATADDDYEDEYTIQPFGPAYYASGGEGDFEILPWGYGTGPKSYFARSRHGLDIDLKVPLIALLGAGLVGAAIWVWRKR